MNYIVFDLEFNQLYSKRKIENSNICDNIHSKEFDTAEVKNIDKTAGKINLSNMDKSDFQTKEEPFKMPFEIIQIGAVKLNQSFEIISTFNSFVKPSLYKEIHPFIEELTSITTEMVHDQPLFPKIYSDFMEFIGDDDFIMCVWGLDDIKQLIRNIQYHNLNIHNNIRKYIDIQHLASKEFNMPKGNKLGLKTAVEFWNIPTENSFHNALNDAVYTAQVFRKIYTKNVKPSIYSNTKLNRIPQKTLKVDTKKLIEQFEKMFSREMTKEEKSIIRIAYNMGKTHQFLK